MTKPTVLFISQLGGPGSYDPAMFCRMAGGDDETEWLRLALVSAGVGEAIEYRAVHVCRGEALPSTEGVDAVILGGSIASVHDGHDWQAATRDFLKAWRSTGRPWFGICGGHQIASQARRRQRRREPARRHRGVLPRGAHRGWARPFPVRWLRRGRRLPLGQL
jgi:putative intracellular protease/amidase